MSEKLYAVVDQGSSGTKAAVVSARGDSRFQTSRKVECRHEKLRVEHDAAQLAAGVREVLEEALQGRDIAAIGLTCQRSTCLLWERSSGEPLTPALSWQDRSQLPAVNRLEEHRGEVARRTGLRLGVM